MYTEWRKEAIADLKVRRIPSYPEEVVHYLKVRVPLVHSKTKKLAFVVLVAEYKSEEEAQLEIENKLYTTCDQLESGYISTTDSPSPDSWRLDSDRKPLLIESFSGPYKGKVHEKINLSYDLAVNPAVMDRLIVLLRDH